MVQGAGRPRRGDPPRARQPRTLQRPRLDRATCPDATLRDGRQAVAAATRACELTAWKDPGLLDTLAAACAEAGDFDAAVRWQTKAGAMVHDAGSRSGFEARLALYRAKKPYHEARP